MTDNPQKQLMLRYAQIVFLGELGKANADDGGEKADILSKLGLTHDEVMLRVGQNLIEEVEC